jgi:hypothetical protein
MSKPKPLRVGPKKVITRKQAIEQYVILRLRAEEIERLHSAVSDFKQLMETLISEELAAIPELPNVLLEMHVNYHPAFTRRAKQGAIAASKATCALL